MISSQEFKIICRMIQELETRLEYPILIRRGKTDNSVLPRYLFPTDSNDLSDDLLRQFVPLANFC